MCSIWSQMWLPEGSGPRALQHLLLGPTQPQTDVVCVLGVF